MIGSVVRMNSMADRRSDRERFLQKLFELTGDDENKLCSMWDVGKELGFDQESIVSIVQYLVGEGLIRMRALGGILSITHYGIIKAEAEQQKQDIFAQPQGTDVGVKTARAVGTKNAVSEFSSKISQLRLWGYFETRACLVKFADDKRWKLTLLNLCLLKEKKVNDSVNFQTDTAKLILEIHDIANLQILLAGLSSGKDIDIGGEVASLELITNNFHFDIITRDYAVDEYHIEYPCYFLGATGNYPRKLMDTVQYLEKILPLTEQPYMDLKHACKSLLNVDHGTPAYGIRLSIFTPIHACIENIEFHEDRISTIVSLDIETSAIPVRMVLFGLDDEGEPTKFNKVLIFFAKNAKNEKITNTIRIDENDTFSSIRAMLFFGHDKIDERIFKRNQASGMSLPRTIIERIDPNFEVLESWLRGRYADPR